MVWLTVLPNAADERLEQAAVGVAVGRQGRPVVQRFAERLRQAAHFGDVVEVQHPLAEMARSPPGRPCVSQSRRRLQQHGDGADLAGGEVALDGRQPLHALAGRRQLAGRPVGGMHLEAEDGQRQQDQQPTSPRWRRDGP